MDENFSRTMEDFASVWLRVCGKEPPSTPAVDEESALHVFIRDACCDASFYTALARMFSSAGRSTLLSHAQECKTRCRLLRAEYFIRSGEMASAKDNCPLVGGKLASLRAVMLRESEQTAAFLRAAQTADEPLRSLYTRFAEEAERRAQTNRTLLLDCF